MLQRVSIQNFKSLKDVTLDLQKVNLLIGPNNSGKTNFLKALELTKILIDGQSQNLDILSYSHRSDSTPFYTINLEFVENYFSLTEESLNFIITTDFEGSQEIPSIYLNYKSIRKENNELIYSFNEELNENFFNFYSKLKKKSFIGSQNDLQIKTRDSFYFIKNYLLHGLKIYTPTPSKITNSTELSKNFELEKDCSNLTAIIFNLMQDNLESFEKIEKGLFDCTNDFTTVRTSTLKSGRQNDGKLNLRFIDKHKRGYWADEVSEGVIYFLAILCIIFQANPPKILLIEEPERGIHPRRIHDVMNFIFRLAEEKDIQVILTTHNENILNYFSNSPESVFVFDKNEEGDTQVRNLKRDIIEPSHQRSRENNLPEIDFTSELGDNWMYGIIGGVPENVL